LRAAAAVFLVAAALAACGGRDEGRATVFGAASLTEVFKGLDPSARFNFAGSDELAGQIEEGARADVFAAASMKYADKLFAENLIERPRIFATNRLVLVVPRNNPARIRSVADAGRDNVKVVVAAEGVPVGDYTRAVLANMGREEVLENVVSNEEDVKGVVAKVAQGEADAGFVYATDAGPVADDVLAIELPATAQPLIEYPIAILTEARHPEAARAFVALVFGGRGRHALREAGFGLP
jgi:molybdate transport system substrate-binding protein